MRGPPAKLYKLLQMGCKGLPFGEQKSPWIPPEAAAFVCSLPPRSCADLLIIDWEKSPPPQTHPSSDGSGLLGEGGAEPSLTRPGESRGTEGAVRMSGSLNRHGGSQSLRLVSGERAAV
ncbi:hypothetical protein SKAU_G00203540 [Synaphobranchus kaupii]|uniref:Uncharacterized protein n=1 Tax=Synaphobranchus kaupii TaxID=118154 RepID=A0A9Q1FGB8_SYNKA|nr:hypothetical protein SKAU_G00203540 [Synaphobranchus kaupii]